MDYDYEKELELLSEYMKVYIQLLPYVVEFGGKMFRKYQLPTFEYYKDNRDWFTKPHLKESKDVYNGNTIGRVHTAGLGSYNGIGYRYYNIFLSCKYFTGGNIEGDYTLVPGEINRVLKSIK